jgi:hypothetical protein
VNAAALREYFAKLDAALTQPATLCIYGSGAFMLLGEEDRFSVDLDIAGPYSNANERELSEAASRIGLPVNPPESYQGDHIEWVGPGRLCLAPPSDETNLVLWKGGRLTVFTLKPPHLIASRLIRYDPTDQADIQFLLIQSRVRFEDVAQAVESLPPAFRHDALVRENLENFRRDLEISGL